jgi:hypothetical protein
VSELALQQGACADLLPQVVDKYFYSHAHTERFQLAVGRAICSHCPVQMDCLEETIVEPPGQGMRGGETNGSLWRLHDRWMDEHVDADVLALEAIEKQRASTAAVLRSPRYRRGEFTSPRLAIQVSTEGGDT